MMAEPQRDITPEQAAERLRTCGGELYRRRLDVGPENGANGVNGHN
jgi:UDPglucose--hexose-1-phosphate uridylyltransferase